MPLAEHFMRRYNEENEKSVTAFTERARHGMLEYPWPGNVRELQHVVEQAVVLCSEPKVDVGDLAIEPPSRESLALRLLIPGLTMAELERYAILRTLEAVGGSTSKAAALLGISRRTVQYRLQEWGLAGYGRGPDPAAEDDEQPSSSPDPDADPGR
jgi:two-component system response regulator HydG